MFFCVRCRLPAHRRAIVVPFSSLASVPDGGMPRDDHADLTELQLRLRVPGPSLRVESFRAKGWLLQTSHRWGNTHPPTAAARSRALDCRPPPTPSPLVGATPWTPRRRPLRRMLLSCWEPGPWPAGIRRVGMGGEGGDQCAGNPKCLNQGCNSSVLSMCVQVFLEYLHRCQGVLSDHSETVRVPCPTEVVR